MRYLSYSLLKIHRILTSGYLLCDKAALRIELRWGEIPIPGSRKEGPWSAILKVDFFLQFFPLLVFQGLCDLDAASLVSKFYEYNFYFFRVCSWFTARTLCRRGWGVWALFFLFLFCFLSFDKSSSAEKSLFFCWVWAGRNRGGEICETTPVKIVLAWPCMVLNSWLPWHASLTVSWLCYTALHLSFVMKTTRVYQTPVPHCPVSLFLPIILLSFFLKERWIWSCDLWQMSLILSNFRRYQERWTLEYHVRGREVPE